MMKTLTLSYSDAHTFVEQNSHRGYFWHGWSVKRWVPNSSGYSSKNGSFKNGVWGLEFTFPVLDSGEWNIKVPANVEYN